jgi:xanthine/CO dehydrogenase XdhC/CoxF family maturation factor
MKTTIKTFAVALALIATAFTVHAEDKETKKSAGFETGIYATKGGKINVLVEKASDDARTTLLLKNEKGDVVYQETIGKKTQRFGRMLNVDELKSGTYQIEVTSQGETKTKSFEVSSQEAERTIAVR